MGFFSWFGSTTSAGIVSDEHLPPVEHRGTANDVAEDVPKHPYAIEADNKAAVKVQAETSTPKKAAVDASPAAKKPEAPSVEDAIDSNDTDSVSVKALTAYLKDKGVTTPKSASKASLVKLAREASKSVARSVSTAKDASESRKRARSASAKSEEPAPDASWTVGQLKAYAKKNNIKVASSAVKADLLAACTA